MSETENKVLLKVDQSFQPPDRMEAQAYVSIQDYEAQYRRSIENPDKFWGEIADQELDWFQKWDQVRKWDPPHYQWFLNGKLNVTVNCLDRHVQNGRRNQVAYIYTNEIGEESKITYGELLEEVNRCANGLKSLGVSKGDTVTIYMAMTLDQIVAILACARIGAIHSVVYGGFSAPALRLRIEDAKSSVVITSTWTRRKGKKVDLKAVTDEAVKDLSIVKHILVSMRQGDDFELFEKEASFQELMAAQDAHCEPEVMDSEDPLFILYTSGTTGKPKGVLHTTAGYLLYTHYTTRTVFNLNSDDIFWCTADPGWITGHSYIIYGPLSVGVTSVISEGAPDFPEPDRWWKIVEKYRVNVFYTAPTAVRLFMKYGDKWPEGCDLSSLRTLGSVGEPINPEAWIWYSKKIGNERCSIVDTWWQTETGGHMIATYPSMKTKPGKAGVPLLGIDADVVDRRGNPVAPDTVGFLIIRKPWPSGLRTCWGDPERYEVYWNSLCENYFPGDLATRDKDGYIMILGRADDVLNVSGHRIGTAEVESALVSHEAIAEAAVIGKPHDVKGESIKAFVTLKHGFSETEGLDRDIKMHVRQELGSLAIPDEIELVDGLPKTRSGKIMRRVLKAKELGEDLGDTSTLED